jgi:hypothetical protein
MDSMRYLFAALIAVALIIFTVDIAQDRSDQPEQAEAFIGLADLQGKLSDAHLEPDKEIIAGRRVLPLAARDSEPYAVSADDGTSSEDNAVTGSPLGYAEAPLLPKQVCEAIRSAAEQNRIPFGFFARLLWQESKFRTEEISAAGAIGIAQFMPQTAAEVGLSDPFDPLQAIPASARFLRKLHDQFGNLGLAAESRSGCRAADRYRPKHAPMSKSSRATRRRTGPRNQREFSSLQACQGKRRATEPAVCPGPNPIRLPKYPSHSLLSLARCCARRKRMKQQDCAPLGSP